MLRRYCIFAVLLARPAAFGADEDTLGWLLQKATTAPNATPATEASRPNPLVKPSAEAAVSATITLSNGERLTGQISTTPGKPLRIWVEEQHEYVDVGLGDFTELRATVLWEREEPEWHFIASGSDVKEFTGKSYPARETAYTFRLRDGREISGSIVAPLYIRADGSDRMLVLHKRDKGQVGQALKDLVYVQQVTFSERSSP